MCMTNLKLTYKIFKNNSMIKKIWMKLMNIRNLYKNQIFSLKII